MHQDEVDRARGGGLPASRATAARRVASEGAAAASSRKTRSPALAAPATASVDGLGGLGEELQLVALERRLDGQDHAAAGLEVVAGGSSTSENMRTS